MCRILVQQAVGFVGYVECAECAYVIQNHLTYADMINQTGKLGDTDQGAFQAAVANADFSPSPEI